MTKQKYKLLYKHISPDATLIESTKYHMKNAQINRSPFMGKRCSRARRLIFACILFFVLSIGLFPVNTHNGIELSFGSLIITAYAADIDEPIQLDFEIFTKFDKVVLSSSNGLLVSNPDSTTNMPQSEFTIDSDGAKTLYWLQNGHEETIITYTATNQDGITISKGAFRIFIAEDNFCAEILDLTAYPKLEKNKKEVIGQSKHNY